MRYVTGAAKSNRLKLFTVFSATALNFGVKFYKFMCFCRTWYIMGVCSRQNRAKPILLTNCSVSSLFIPPFLSHIAALSSPFDVAQALFG